MPLDRIVTFLREIGLPVAERSLPDKTFVPGILIENGGLVIDRARLTYPGDLLHEAGHIAVTPPSQRAAMSGDLNSTQADEIAAQAWSYAAAVHLGIDPAVVFHPAGYHGASESLLAAMSGPGAPGSPLLHWFGLTRMHDDGSGAPIFPRMSAWLRPEPVESAN
ncbi:MAG: hypothetical protein HZA32_17560 [Opitutae bacterium]|nr:hypothetical protein [Opitutae bacterium]